MTKEKLLKIRSFLLTEGIIEDKNGEYTINNINESVNISSQNKYAQYSATGSVYSVTESDSKFMTEDNIVSVETLNASATVTQSDPRKPFKCNFKFNLDLGIKLDLPDLNAPPPNFHLFKSIQYFASEIQKINLDIQKSLKEMNCCDLAHAYNHTLVPFFRWFADHKDVKNCTITGINEDNSCGPMFGGNTLPMVLFDIAKSLIQAYIVIRPLVCLLRPVPGNPWFINDFDQMSLISGFVNIFDVLYDLLISGKLFDNIFLNPTIKLRQTLDNCLFKPHNSLRSKKINNNLDNLLKKLRDKEKNRNAIQLELTQLKNKKFYIENSLLTIEIEEDIPGQTNTSSLIPTENSSNNFLILLTINDLYNDNQKFDNETLYERIEEKIDFDSYDVNKKYKFNFTFEVDESYNFNSILNNLLNIKYKKYTNSENTNYKNTIKTLKDKLDNLKDEIKDINKDINDKTNDFNQAKRDCNKLIESIDKATLTQQKELNESIATISQTYKTKSSMNIMGNSASICSCIQSSLESLFNKEFRLPMPETITSLDKTGFKNVMPKDSFKLKIKDFDDPSGIPGLCYPNRSYNDVQDKDFRYTENFVDSFVASIKASDNIEYIKNSIIFKTITKDTIAYAPAPSNVTLAEYKLTEENYRDSLKNSENDKPQFKDTANLYFKVVDKIMQQDLRVLYDIKKKEITIDYPDEGSVNYDVAVFDEDILPTIVYPSKYAYLTELTKNVFLMDMENNITRLQPICSNILEKDVNKWVGICNSIKKALVKTEIDLAEHSFTSPYDLIKRKQTLKELKEMVCNTYPKYDLDHKFSLEYIYDTYKFAKNGLGEDTITTALYDILDQRKKNLKPLIYYFNSIDNMNKMEKWLSDATIINEVTWDHVHVPCTCDGIICKLIQKIINFLLSMLTQFIKRWVNIILEFFWNSWLGKLIKFLIAKIRCFMELVNMKADLDKLDKLRDNLVEGLKHNITLYADPTTCLRASIDVPNNIPDETTSTTSGGSGSGGSNNDGGGDSSDNTDGGSTTNTTPSSSSSMPTIEVNTTEDSNTIITSGGAVSPDVQLPDSQTNSVTSQATNTMTTTAQVIIGANIHYSDHIFPLLNFNCECEDGDCSTTCDEAIREATIQVLTQ